jgi:hypothetical protein
LAWLIAPLKSRRRPSEAGIVANAGCRLKFVTHLGRGSSKQTTQWGPVT